MSTYILLIKIKITFESLWCFEKAAAYPDSEK